jgi:hypothetical protein
MISAATFGEKLGHREPNLGVHLRLVIRTHEKIATHGAATTKNVTSTKAFEYGTNSLAFLGFLRASASLLKKYRVMMPGTS